MTRENQIYVDLDDVLSETGRVLVEVLQQEFGRNVAFEDMHTFDLTISFGLTERELESFFHAFHRDKVLERIEPVEGALETLWAWVDTGYEISIVTGRPLGTEKVSRRWLERHDVPYESLTFVDKYSRPAEHGFGTGEGGGRALPLEALAARSFRLAVEDSLEVARFLSQALGVEVGLFDRPWNRQSPDLLQGVTRCRSWNDIRRLL